MIYLQNFTGIASLNALPYVYHSCHYFIIQTVTKETTLPEDRENKISCSNFTNEMEVALEVISGKWKSTIIWNLYLAEKIRFNEFFKIIPGITQKMLTQQLRKLEDNKLVTRTVYPSTPPTVEYSLTPLAQDVIPILENLNQWGKKVIQSYTR